MSRLERNGFIRGGTGWARSTAGAGGQAVIVDMKGRVMQYVVT